MKYSPHDYQAFAIEYIESHPICAVFLDMGLGKTSITLSAIFNLLFDSFEVRKVLIVAPLRVARDTWKNEIQKWDHLKSIIYSVAVGSEEERKNALMQKADIYIINRENLPWLAEKSNLAFDFDMIVIDELSSFKNSATKRFRALMKIRPKAKRIVGLSGTPASNGLMDLWAEFRILDMGERLGRFIGGYRNSYFTPDKRNGQIVFRYKPLPYAEKMIYEKISDITISMKSTDHLNMPRLMVNEYPVTLSEKEQKLYKQLKQDLVISLNSKEITASNAASLSNKLCQLANGAIYDDNGTMIPIHNRKLDALEDLIESANGKPVLIAYWFLHDLKRIKERLQQLKISYSTLDDTESISKWNNKALSVGLIHPQSAGHGLNLQFGGSILIWYGLTWSLELYQQTNARLWRQGQIDDTVVIQHIITKGTIDECILKALTQKEHTQSALIAAVKADLSNQTN